jgi:hypothetical protein
MIKRENGRVLIDISQEDFNELLFVLGCASGLKSEYSDESFRLLNIINEWNTASRQDQLDYACQQAVGLAKRRCRNIVFDINGITLVATKITDPKDLARNYMGILAKRSRKRKIREDRVNAV